MTDQPANVKNSAAKTATPPPARNLAANLSAAKTPPAPDGTIDLGDFSKAAVAHLYLLATAAGPVGVSGPDSPPTRRLSLDGLCKRHLAVADGGQSPTYVLSEQGRALASLIWPDSKPAPKRARKPAARKVGKLTITDTTTGDAS